MRRNDPVVGQIFHFGPFPLETAAKGAPKRWKTNLHQICFSKLRMIWYHKGSPPVLFWDENRSCLGRGGLSCGNSVPKFELDSVQMARVVLLAPSFMNHLVISFKHDLYQKSHICSVDPL